MFKGMFLSRPRRRTFENLSAQQQRSMLCDQLSFTAAESYKQLRANLLFALPDDYRVFPGHEEPTTIGYERLHNPIRSEGDPWFN